MWVCHCHAVTDSHVREAIATGAADEIEIGAVRRGHRLRFVP